MNLFNKSNDNTDYYNRRIPTIIFLRIGVALLSLFSTMTAIGYLEIITGSYISPTLSFLMSVVVAVGIDISKAYFLELTVKEGFKLKYLDLITGFCFLVCLCISLFSSLQGIELKKKFETMKIELSDSIGTKKDSAMITLRVQPPAPTLREKRKFLSALASVEKLTYKNDSIRSLKTEKRKALLKSFTSSKFEVNFWLMLFLELFIFIFCFGIGYIESRKKALKEAPPIDKDKLRAKFVTARSRFKKAPDNKNYEDAFNRLKEQLDSLGIQEPKEIV